MVKEYSNICDVGDVQNEQSIKCTLKHKIARRETFFFNLAICHLKEHSEDNFVICLIEYDFKGINI